MAIHNSSYDAANTAVRAFLTKVGASYWGKTFNTGVGNGKSVWLTIKNELFNGMCCYCGFKSDKLQIEHLIMFNRIEYGLHHPGNVVPVCYSCNKRGKNSNGEHLNWENHLRKICEEQGRPETFEEKKTKIFLHITNGKFAYPQLSDNEKHAIRVIAETLYNNVKIESDNSLVLYGKITHAFVGKNSDI
ncbi:MAG: HNH endonuclease [Candidatus Omnitrophica bacterium]|nr:HNH endonuclease [Candidatus Omnitrophota bacterium]